MTIYEKKLSSQLLQRYPQITPEEMIAKLIEIGVVDATRCKVLSVREYVNSLLQQGYKKNRRHVESYRNLLLLLRIYP